MIRHSFLLVENPPQISKIRGIDLGHNLSNACLFPTLDYSWITDPDYITAHVEVDSTLHPSKILATYHTESLYYWVIEQLKQWLYHQEIPSCYRKVKDAWDAFFAMPYPEWWKEHKYTTFRRCRTPSNWLSTFLESLSHMDNLMRIFNTVVYMKEFINQAKAPMLFEIPNESSFFVRSFITAFLNSILLEAEANKQLDAFVIKS